MTIPRVQDDIYDSLSMVFRINDITVSTCPIHEECDELYFIVSKKKPDFQYCRISIKDLSILNFDDENLVLTEEEYNSVLNDLSKKNLYCDRTNWYIILENINMDSDRNISKDYQIPDRM